MAMQGWSAADVGGTPVVEVLEAAGGGESAPECQLEKRTSESEEEHPARKPAMRPASPREATLSSAAGGASAFGRAWRGLRGRNLLKMQDFRANLWPKVNFVGSVSNDTMVAGGTKRLVVGKLIDG